MTTGDARSRVTAIDIDAVEPVGEFGGIAYERVRGTVLGVLGPDEDVAGIDLLPMVERGCYPYRSEFEVIRGEGVEPRVTVVDAENRGGPSVFGLITGVNLRAGSVPERGVGAPSEVTYPVGMGPGCLFDAGVAYARVQWQTGHAESVPVYAQGVGPVVVRDFARLLRNGRRPELGRHPRLILSGASQSAWFVNTFVAEGFNEDPADGGAVFAGALPYLSAGNWLAINRLADDGVPQDPYVRPDGVPLTAAEVLQRPASDPFLVDVASYTEYYRMRASVFASAPLPERARRYDLPGPHAPGSPDLAAAAFDLLGCNDGVVVPLNPTNCAPYVRALLVGLANELGAELDGALGGVRLLPTTAFTLGPAPAAGPNFNALPGVELQVPRVDADAQPVGGVRAHDVELPLGRPEPVALSPCGTSSITDVCGNFGGWQPFPAEEVAHRYVDADTYVARCAAIVGGLVDDGFVLARDRDSVLESARGAVSRALAAR
jgi:hypothetical protein